MLHKRSKFGLAVRLGATMVGFDVPILLQHLSFEAEVRVRFLARYYFMSVLRGVGQSGTQAYLYVSCR